MNTHWSHGESPLCRVMLPWQQSVVPTQAGGRGHLVGGVEDGSK